ncbi:hypothetical protein OSB94_18260 [Proteus vulgaris]|uniref:hypothetical protein n=1 Tax=Proteus vulgaris TaxID=585 RepID=UPI00287550DB|nr:hypothetical protein [Proteus vulgaris]MDS0790040.1 hypothetical protein [Proteus vulgaris]
MEFKGSKAPWHIGSHPFEYRNRHTVRCDNNSVIAHIMQPGDTESAATAQADTRLIAAAPELLEALQSIQQSMAKYIEVANNIGVEALADGFYLGHAIDVEEKARQAIAKALGQQ